MIERQKKSFIVLAVAGVLALIFGIWRIGYNIKNPFKLKPFDKSFFTESNIFDSQNKDTDGDGISDFDETNLYNTSPYLEDTDSDGKWDGDEIKTGSDPNCPEGKDCQAEIVGKNADSAVLDLSNTPFGSNAVSAPLGGAPAASNQIPQTLDAAEIRKMLKDAGMKEDDLKKMDDKALMQIYQEAAKEANRGQ